MPIINLGSGTKKGTDKKAKMASSEKKGPTGGKENILGSPDKESKLMGKKLNFSNQKQKEKSIISQKIFSKTVKSDLKKEI